MADRDPIYAILQAEQTKRILEAKAAEGDRQAAEALASRLAAEAAAAEQAEFTQVRNMTPEDQAAYNAIQSDTTAYPEQWGVTTPYGDYTNLDGKGGIHANYSWEDYLANPPFDTSHMDLATIRQRWVEQNEHADKYREDPTYRQQWDDSHGDMSDLGMLFTAGVGGMIGAGAMGALGGGATQSATTSNVLSGSMGGAGPGTVTAAGTTIPSGAALATPTLTGATLQGGSAGPGGVYSGSTGAVVPNSTVAAGAANAGNYLTTSAPAIGGAANAITPSTSGGSFWDNISGTDLAILGGSLASGALSYNSTENAMDEIGRQYDQNREDMMPWLESGRQNLDLYNQEVGDTSPIYDEFQAPQGSNLPNYAPTDAPPEYQSRGDFEFNLQEDPIYQYQLEQSQKAIERAMGARGYNNSGNVLTELSRDAIGQAGQYQNQAFGRQLAGSQENYGRGVQDYGINAQRNQDIYNRNVTDYGIGTDRANTLYGRGVSEYGMGAQRNQDMYGRDQNYLNRLAALSNTGQTAASTLGQMGTNSANSLAGLNVQQGSGINNAIQGGISNYMLSNYLQNDPYRRYR